MPGQDYRIKPFTQIVFETIFDNGSFFGDILVPTVKYPPKTDSADVPHPTLTAEAHTYLSALQDLLRRLLLSLPRGWGSVSQLAEDLGVERTLAWKISRMAAAPDSFAVALHLPGERAMKRIWNAASKSKVDPGLVEEARNALARYRGLKTQEEDPASLSLIVGAQATHSGRKDLDLAQRRAAFRSNSYFLGISAHVFYDASFFAPSPSDPEFLDMATIRGFRELTRLRNDIAWPIARRIASVELDGEVEHLGQSLAPEDADQGIPLLKMFSSPNLPKLVELEASGGFSRFAIEPPTIGRRGSLDVFLGERYAKTVKSKPTSSEPNHAVAVYLRTPCRVAVIEQFVSRAAYGSLRMSASAVSTIFGEPTLSCIQGEQGLRVPLFESVEHLGPADRVAPVRSMPEYNAMISLGARGVGCRLEDLDVYRLTLEYPPEPIAVVMKAPLSE